MSDNVNHITPGVEHNGNYATYLRKSKDDQMNSIEAQRKEINHFLNGGSWRITKEFVETASGGLDQRPIIMKAINFCQKKNATLLFTKMDRFSRDTGGLFKRLLMSRVKYVDISNPLQNHTQIDLQIMYGQTELKNISERTKKGLAVVKAGGKVLGSKILKTVSIKGSISRIKRSLEYALLVYPYIEQAQKLGIKSFSKIGLYLTEVGIETPAAFYAKNKEAEFIPGISSPPKFYFLDKMGDKDEDGNYNRQWRAQQVKNVINKVKNKDQILKEIKRLEIVYKNQMKNKGREL